MFAWHQHGPYYLFEYCVLPSITHTFTTSHTDSAFMLYHTSYCSYCLITNIGTIVTKKLSIAHDTNIVPITYLSISTTRYYFLPSLSHRFTFGPSDLTRMLYHTSYYMETAHYKQRLRLLSQNIVLFC